jgi:hypothetical protein
MFGGSEAGVILSLSVIQIRPAFQFYTKHLAGAMP